MNFLLALSCQSSVSAQVSLSEDKRKSRDVPESVEIDAPATSTFSHAAAAKLFSTHSKKPNSSRCDSDS